MRPSYRYLRMHGLGDDGSGDDGSGSDGNFTDTSNWSSDDSTVTPAAAPASPAGADPWGALFKDFGSLTGINSQTNTGGADYASTQQMAAGGVPGQPAPGASAAPGGSAANPDATGSWSNFFDADSCGTNFCMNDLFDPKQPYLWIGVVGLVGLAIFGARK